ncbi:MAG: dUTP diphosphatase [Deltaproteobacteria bacterium]|uniref:Deoxyuridine 5'-triphosphate nucleotidohydrolase n=1 Tax=Candidatus Zymogenus saltonus TaxID=2844893 RepID=A0A9D8PNK3_9DELT|nr:dUTP diphosphatase [Candidatus Zymogenus saltonus]
MKEIKIRVKRVGGFSGRLPQYKTAGSAGVDLTAHLERSLSIRPMERVLIPTGIAVEIPEGYEGQVRPRSGLALKHGITTVNTPGTIDSDYRGEIGVIMVNLGDTPFDMNPGDRIAQLVISPVVHLVWEDVDELTDTERGEGGFGSSGK